ncbi:MAG: tRNA lysidine(34) synthetase TilS, partial [Anaerolineaceae bacterium]
AHFDHMLRPGSANEAEKLRALAREWGYQLARGQGDVNQFARSERLSVEEAARILRYRFLFDLAGEQQAAAVLTAHNADDQVETVLMHILRGAGTAGLAGMRFCQLPNAWSDRIPLVRALLDVSRAEIMAYCVNHALTPFMDETNQDARYTRNRIRTRLIPLLEREYNPQIRQAILRLSQAVGDEAALAARVVGQAWQNCLSRQGRGFLAFEFTCLQTEDPAVQRLILRRAVRSLAVNEEEVSYDAVERGISFLAQPAHGKEVQFVQGVFITHVRDEIIISLNEGAGWLEDYPRIAHPADVQPGQEAALENGWVMSVGPVCANEPGACQAEQADRYQICVDAGRLTGALRVRAVQPGDRVQPLGMGGQSLKVSDLLINEKIPRRARAGFPVVLCGDETVWVPGCRMGHGFRITPGSQTCITLRVFRPD